MDLYKELITKSKGDVSKLSTIFDSEAMRAFNAGITEFKNTGGLKSIDEFMGVASDGATIKADALRANAGNINASMTALATAGKQFADVNLAGPVTALADAIGKLQPEQVQSTMKALAYGAAAVGGLIAIKKGVDAVRWTADTVRYIKGGKGAKGGVAGALSGAAGSIAGGSPIPVMVVNWPGGSNGLGGGVVDLAGKDKSAAGKSVIPTTASAVAPAAAGRGVRGMLGRVASRGGRVLGAVARRAGPALTVGLGAYDAIDSYLDGDKRSAIGAVGRTAGSLLGAVGGGALGSFAGPLGTMAGGFAGSQAGGMGGEALAERLYDWLAGEKERKNEPTKVESTVALRLDLPPGVTAQATNLSHSSGLDVDLGYTLGGP